MQLTYIKLTKTILTKIIQKPLFRIFHNKPNLMPMPNWLCLTGQRYQKIGKQALSYVTDSL